MTPEACRDWRGAIAAAALGRLDPGEQVALQAHLDGCAACRAELRELEAVARGLPLADIERVRDAAEPPRELASSVFDRVAQTARQSRRRRVQRIAAIAAAFVAVVAIAAGVVVWNRDDDDGTEVALGSTAHATLHATPIGTEVDFEAAELHDGEWYWLWVTGEDGDRVTAGTFRGTKGKVHAKCTAALSLEDTRRIWVTDEDDEIILDARVPAAH